MLKVRASPSRTRTRRLRPAVCMAQPTRRGPPPGSHAPPKWMPCWTLFMELSRLATPTCSNTRGGKKRGRMGCGERRGRQAGLAASGAAGRGSELPQVRRRGGRCCCSTNYPQLFMLGQTVLKARKKTDACLSRGRPLAVLEGHRLQQARRQQALPRAGRLRPHLHVDALDRSPVGQLRGMGMGGWGGRESQQRGRLSCLGAHGKSLHMPAWWDLPGPFSLPLAQRGGPSPSCLDTTKPWSGCGPTRTSRPA